MLVQIQRLMISCIPGASLMMIDLYGYDWICMIVCWRAHFALTMSFSVKKERIVGEFCPKWSYFHWWSTIIISYKFALMNYSTWCFFRFFSFSPRSLGRYPIWRIAYFSDGWLKSPTRKPGGLGVKKGEVHTINLATVNYSPIVGIPFNKPV